MTQVLKIPEPLKQEFATVETIWDSKGETRRVDALILSWVKYEKQLRRLFCFLVFQHPKITKDQIGAIISVLVENTNLNPQTFVMGINELGVTSVRDLLAERYAPLSCEMARIKNYRNKVMHGQISGQGINSSQLERDVIWIVEWISRLALAAERVFGYDGLKRNTYRRAKSVSRTNVADYPFSTPADLEKWLCQLVKKSKARPVK